MLKVWILLLLALSFGIHISIAKKVKTLEAQVFVLEQQVQYVK